jgi:hypothetical protein
MTRQRDRIAALLKDWNQLSEAERHDIADAVVEFLQLSLSCARGCRLGFVESRRALPGVASPPKPLYCLRCGRPHEGNAKCGRDKGKDLRWSN